MRGGRLYTVPCRSMQLEEVQVLPELSPSAPLRHTRLGSLDPYRRPQQTRQLDVRLQRLEAAMTPWPAFLYDMFDYKRIRQEFCDFFKKLGLDNLPEEPVSLSFWVASNLALSARDQAALLATDCALHRLHLALRLMAAKTILCCSSCRTEIARRDHIFAMSSEGVHSNYTNLGGYMHDVVTVSAAQNTALEGLPSAEYSWFPGYTWTIALCAACAAHVGWRFEALKRNLWPQQFYGLCRTSVQPRAADLTLP